MNYKILRSANVQYHSYYSFFYRKNKGDLPLQWYLAFEDLSHFISHTESLVRKLIYITHSYHESGWFLSFDMNCCPVPLLCSQKAGKFHELKFCGYNKWYKNNTGSKTHQRQDQRHIQLFAFEVRLTQPLICVGCSVHYCVPCAINKKDFLRSHFRRRHTFASVWGACLRFASLWCANSRGDSCVLGVHLSKVCWGLIFCLRKAFIF